MSGAGPTTDTHAAGSPLAAGPARMAPEACPLCGAPLAAEQEWCMSCGAAARTRLAGVPNWRAPVAIVTILAVLALGVLAAGLVKVAADSGPTPTPLTTTVTTTTPAAATSTPTTSTTP